MTVIKGKIVGKEQLILLPHTESKVFNLATDPPNHVAMNTGPHVIVASGYLGLNTQNNGSYGFWLHDVDDEDVISYRVHALVGPLWRNVVQVSAMAGIGGILSFDSDEVDESRWTIRECKWDSVKEPGGERIRLKIKIQIQGEQNGWESISYQVVATGWLRRMPAVDEISADI